MCELPNYGRVQLATGVMALWLRSGDGRALRTHALVAMERRTIHSGLSIGREESQRIVSGRSPTTGLGSLDATSAVWAFYVQVAVPMRLPDAGRLQTTRERCLTTCYNSLSILADVHKVAIAAHLNP
jgi:hypothetical protein